MADGDRNTFTVRGLKTILGTLKTMPKLTVLDMQLPHLEELDISENGIR
jgi:hypothetical protein